VFKIIVTPEDIPPGRGKPQVHASRSTAVACGLDSIFNNFPFLACLHRFVFKLPHPHARRSPTCSYSPRNAWPLILLHVSCSRMRELPPLFPAMSCPPLFPATLVMAPD
jgi:hypothetical protein